jgi:hypothetical protein
MQKGRTIGPATAPPRAFRQVRFSYNSSRIRNPLREHVLLHLIQDLFGRGHRPRRKDPASGCGMTAQGFSDAGLMFFP